LPAAMMATATRGAVGAFEAGALVDFFIRLTIP
jgi:hypothetical protein